MKTNSMQKEILLVTNNSFAQREWCQVESDDKNLTPQEQMEEICANGAIHDILPEVFKAPANEKLYLWQMRPGFSFLQLQYGEFPLALENYTSIDPHNSLPFMCNN